MKKFTLNRILNFWAVFLLLIFCSQQTFGATIEQMKAGKVTLEIVNLKISDALDALSKNSSVRIFYKSDLKDLQKRISMDLKEEQLQDALSKVLAGTSLGYEFSDDGVVITTKGKAVTSVTQQKKITVKGRVIGDDKKPIAGATILVQGTSNGAISDEMGAFTLSLNVGDMIQVSYVGMKNLDRKITDSMSDLILIMEKSAVEIDEVIVTGYQEISKTRMTGSVETITSKDISNKGYTSVSDILKGQMAGVSTMSVSGRPGASAEIRIRGINSLTGSSDPLWIVDGMPLQGDVPSISMGGTEFQQSVLTDGVGNIPPDDIESITVLKDAAATAIYGSRAANGVIVIKTKRGTAGKSSIRAQVSYALTEAPQNRLMMMNSRQKLDYERSIYEDFPGISTNGRGFNLLKNADYGLTTREYAEKEIARLAQINTNWFDEIFRMGESQNHAVTLSGGDEKTLYYANLSYISEKGIIPNNKYQSFGGSLKLTHDFNKRLRIHFDIRSSIRNDRVTGSSVDVLKYATFANPYERPYDENGNYEYDRSYNSELSSIKDGYKYDFNVLQDLNENTSRSKYLSNQLTLKLEINILNGLMFSTMGTYSVSKSSSKRELMPGTFTSKTSSWLNGIYSESEVPGEFNLGKMSETSSGTDSWTIRNQLEYARGFDGENHYLNLFLGQEVSSSETDGFSSTIPEWDPIYGLASYPNLEGMVIPSNSLLSNLGSHNESQDRSVSFFMTASYSFKDRYVVSGSARLDGADIIGTANRFQPLWNASFKWNIHKEKFMQNVQFINQLAFRGSYGYTGSIDRGVLPFSTLERFTGPFYDNPIYDGEPVMNKYYSAQPSVKWQKKEDMNIGFDLSMLKNRFNVVANYYNNDMRNIIGVDYVAMSTGYSKLKANLASINNKGWELSVKTVNITTKDFTWITSLSFSYNKNTITKTEEKELATITTEARLNPNKYIQGYSSSAVYGYQFAGVDPYTGGTLAYVDGYDKNGVRLGSPYHDGRYVYNMDVIGTPNNQGMPQDYRAAARNYLGDTYPPYSGGFSTQFNYKRLSLSANFAYFTGHIIDSYRTRFVGNTVYQASNNVLAEEANRWRKPGDVTMIPKYSTNLTARNTFFFDDNYESGNYLKCTNISFGYNIPQKICDVLLLSNARFNFNVANVFTITKYRGIDPETRGSFGYPSARRYNFSLSLGF